MPWFVRLTRYASVHLVYAQQESNSCGIGCILMTNFKMKKSQMLMGMAKAAGVSAIPIYGAFRGAELHQAAVAAAIKSEAEVYAAYSKVSGAPYVGTTDTNADYLATTLQNLRLGRWEAKDVGIANVPQAIKDSTDAGNPIICRTRWANGQGHFVVIDETHDVLNLTAAVNDPWDGELHVIDMKLGEALKYHASDEPDSWSTWGKRNSYARGSWLTFGGYVIRRVG